MRLSFLVLPDRIFIISGRKFRLNFGVTPVTRIQIRELVRKWHELATARGASRNLVPLTSKGKYEESSKEMARIIEELANCLQIPFIFKSLPRRIRALTIVPDDSLHGLPFAIMLYEGKHLVEHFSISIGFEHIARRAGSVPFNGRQALLVGISQGTDSFNSLPGTRREIEEIGSWFQTRKIKSRILMDDSASKEAVSNDLPNSRYFHIACHGIFKPDQPDSSGMILIAKPDQVEILSLRALYRMNLTRLQHVTLSSCWSADNFILPGRWIISLPETFWRAGAQSILGCLWPVYDGIAVPFMKRFYDLLAKYPRDKALRLTQLECLNSGLPGCAGIDTSNPIYWSGFQLYGQPYSLKF
jgi:CHAT domain-containing protein